MAATPNADVSPIPLKVYVPSRGFQIGLAARSLGHLRAILEAKLGLTDKYKLTLEDGTIVCDPEYFKLLEKQTKITVVEASSSLRGAIANEQRKRQASSLPSLAKRIKTSTENNSNDVNVDLNTNHNNSQILSNICISSVAGNVPMSPSPVTSPQPCSPQPQTSLPSSVNLPPWSALPPAPQMRATAPQPFLQQPCPPVHRAPPVYCMPQGLAPVNQRAAIPRPTPVNQGAAIPRPTPHHVQWIPHPRFIQPQPHEVVYRQQLLQHQQLNQHQLLQHQQRLDMERQMQYQMQMQIEQNLRATISVSPPTNIPLQPPPAPVQPSVQVGPVSVQRPPPVQSHVGVHPFKAAQPTVLNSAAVRPSTFATQQPLTVQSGCIQTPSVATPLLHSTVAAPPNHSPVIVPSPVAAHSSVAAPPSVESSPVNVQEHTKQVTIQQTLPSSNQVLSSPSCQMSPPVAVNSPPSHAQKSSQTSPVQMRVILQQSVLDNQALPPSMQPQEISAVSRPPGPAISNEPAPCLNAPLPRVCIPDGTHEVKVVNRTSKSPPVLLQVIGSNSGTEHTNEGEESEDEQGELQIVESEGSVTHSLPSSPQPSPSPGDVSQVATKPRKPDHLSLSLLDDGYCSATTSSLSSADDVKKALLFASFDDFIPLHCCYEDNGHLENNARDHSLVERAPRDSEAGEVDKVSPHNESTMGVVNRNKAVEDDIVDSLVVALPIQVIDGQIYYDQHGQVRDKIMVKHEFTEVIIIDLESEEHDSDVDVMNKILDDTKCGPSHDFNLSLNEDKDSELEDASENITIFMSDNNADIANEEVVVAEHGAEVPVVTTPLDSRTPLINISQCVADIIRAAQYGDLKMDNDRGADTPAVPNRIEKTDEQSEIIEENVLIESSDVPQADSDLVMGNEIILSTEGSSQLHIVDDMDNDDLLSNLLLHSLLPQNGSRITLS